MRPFTVGALFILLGIILLQAAFADKEGKFKYYETFAPCRIVERECEGDASCPGRQKCRKVKCTMKCVDPKYKEGKCKYNIFAPCRIEQGQCEEDESCPGKQKCCNVRCAMRCVDPESFAE
ncbi:supwaprin-a-like [Aquarana catesbeiana]|uniref:supwaprin-a-like n=1 Tax=Aquarana catesbeiana TaxID=8400 RepID=UPI003CC93730